MNKINKTFFLCGLLVLLCVASSSSVFSRSWDPPNKLTGAPNESNCTQCHADNSLNASGGSFMLTVPGNYTPGQEYDIVVDLTRAGQSRWGFQMTALNSSNLRAGTFATTDENTKIDEENSKQYIEQTLRGTAAGTRDSNSWTFKWIAPSNDVGPITFYAAGNAADSNFGLTGDYIYTQKATSDSPPVYGVSLEGVGELSKTVNTGTETKYTLNVTNNGNTRDTITLSTSGISSARLSRTSVTLASKTSTNVILTIPGSALTSAREYEVKVTATSQGDSSKTAEITTTTTVPAVYGVSLSGTSLTKETADATTGVSYTIHVKNTGNTSDTFSLTTSGDATATISPSSPIFLSQGDSRTVTLRISGTALAKAGDYNVKLTATSQNDSTKTAEITTTTTILPVYDIAIEGVSELTTATTDASEGVSYTLKITNNGNTNDTIDLATEGTAATLSQMSVTLEAGASAEIMLTISGEILALAGEYNVMVTATSQGDDTQTADVTTTTTVLPVYGVTLASDTLTGATMDAVTGVTYTLTVTNTGNIDDTIVLGASAEVGIGGAVLGSYRLPDSEGLPTSPLEIMLAAGASAEVMFTAAGDLLTQPGEYEIVVTATSQGDTEKTAQLTTTTTIAATPFEYGVQLQGVGELSSATWNFLQGVTYTLTITNTGNTEDTIVLGSSAEVGIGGAVLGSFSLPDSEEPATSQLQITLAADESIEVKFTASGDLLTQPGEYEIVVKATSQGDTTKTVEITTTTTINHVPWDLNNDGKINILDLVAVANQFGQTGEELSGDVNMDGTVNILDLVAVANQFGKTSAEIVQAANQ